MVPVPVPVPRGRMTTFFFLRKKNGHSFFVRGTGTCERYSYGIPYIPYGFFVHTN